MEPSHDYSLVRQPSYPSELNFAVRGSLVEVPVDQLSGDEAMEKSFAAGSMHTSLFQRTDKANLFLSGVTVMKSMVGVGLLGIPNVVKNFGILPTLLVIGFIFLCTNMASEFLIRSKNLSKHSNYTTIAFFTFENRFLILFINLIIMFCNLGVCMSELIIFGTTSENLVGMFDIDQPPWYLDRTYHLIGIGIILIPLVTVKKIEKLRFVSFVAMISITTFTFIIIYNFFKLLSEGNLAKDYGLLPTEFVFEDAFGALPNAILAYNWKFNQFPIYKGLENPRYKSQLTVSDARLRKAAWIGTALGTALYLVVGIFGYMTYGNQVETNFLKTINRNQIGDALYIVLNITFTLSTTLTLPLIFFCSRNNCISVIDQITDLTKRKDQVFENRTSQEQREQLVRHKKQKKKYDKIKFYAVSLIIEWILVFLAIYVTSLGTVFNFVGAIGANAITALLPSLFYFSLVKKFKESRLLSPRQKRWFYGAQLYFLYSIFILFICVGSEIMQLTNSDKNAKD